MDYQYITIQTRKADLESRMREIEMAHYQATQMLAAGNRNQDPANGPTIGSPADRGTPEELIAKWEEEHVTLLAAHQDLCKEEAEPAPEPAPVEPVPIEPAPVEPVPEPTPVPEPAPEPIPEPEPVIDPDLPVV